MLQILLFNGNRSKAKGSLNNSHKETTKKFPQLLAFAKEVVINWICLIHKSE